MADVLVAYGTKYGATAEIAEAIGRALREEGMEVDVLPARKVPSLDGYSAVVLGSAVYAGRWRGDAMRLLKRLKGGEVWLFSSGPVGEDPEEPAKAERFVRPKAVEAAARRLAAHEHVVFGGKVDVDRGFLRKRMAQGMPEELRDRRDWEAIAGWARGIAAALGSGG